MLDYVHDRAAIYQQVYATVRAEADLSGFPAEMATVVVRMIAACGEIDLTDDIDYSPGLVGAARTALRNGAPILCDCDAVAATITRYRLPAQNEVICTMDEIMVPGLAILTGNTRHAAALEFWRDKLADSVVAIGTEPTALFRLLEMLSDGAPRPAAVVGVPTGFVDVIESKKALAEFGIEYLTVHGRRGGSAVAAAAIDALADERESFNSPIRWYRPETTEV